MPNASVIAVRATATAPLELSRVLSADAPEYGCHGAFDGAPLICGGLSKRP